MRRLIFLGLLALAACGKSRGADQTDYADPTRVASSSFHWVVSEGGAAGFLPTTGNSSTIAFHGVDNANGVKTLLQAMPRVALQMQPKDVCPLVKSIAPEHDRVSLDLSLGSDITPDVASCIRTIAPPALSFYQTNEDLTPAQRDLLTHLDHVEALGINFYGDAVLMLLGERAGSADSASLRYINLVHGRPSPQALAALTKRKNLMALGFRGVKTNAFPSGLALFALLPQLERIDFSYTDITDTEIAAYAQSKTLRWLNLEATTATDAGVRTLGGLGQLEYLNLNATQVGDDAVATLGGLTKLRWLSLVGTRVTPKVLDTLAKLTALEHLDISSMTGLDAFRAAHPKLTINAPG